MVDNNILGDGGHDWSGTIKASSRCGSCDGRGYNMRPLECNFPKPSVAMFKVICGVCNGTGAKLMPIVLRTASEIEGERRKRKGLPPVKRDGSHGE